MKQSFHSIAKMLLNKSVVVVRHATCCKCDFLQLSECGTLQA